MKKSEIHEAEVVFHIQEMKENQETVFRIRADLRLSIYTDAFSSAAFFMRPVFPLDYRALKTCFGDEKNMRYVGSGSCIKGPALKKLIVCHAKRNLDQSYTSEWSIITHDGLAGSFWTKKNDLSTEVEICYALSPQFSRRGLATNAGKLVLQYRYEYPDFTGTIFATVHPHNEFSRRVLEKLGLKPDPERQNVLKGGSVRNYYQLAVKKEPPAILYSFYKFRALLDLKTIVEEQPVLSSQLEVKGNDEASRLIGHQPPTVVLFLDIDGVLLNPKDIADFKEAFYNAIKNGDVDTLKTKGVARFSQKALALLHKLIHTVKIRGFNCEIAIISSWRGKLSVEQLKELFSGLEFAQDITGRAACHTDTLLSFNDALPPYKFSLNRAELVETWVRANAETHNIVNYVVIDDDNDKDCFTDLCPNHYVQPTGGELSDKDFERSVGILNAGNPTDIERPVNDFSVLMVQNQNKKCDHNSDGWRVPIQISEKRRDQMLLPLFGHYALQTALKNTIDSENSTNIAELICKF